jgi:hypothetical protein
MTAINNPNDFNKKGDYLWQSNQTKYQRAGYVKPEIVSGPF